MGDVIDQNNTSNEMISARSAETENHNNLYRAWCVFSNDGFLQYFWLTKKKRRKVQNKASEIQNGKSIW